MAKINLLTIHWGNSYGAVFQTYATCRLLESFGHDVTVINLIHKKAVDKFKHIKEYTNLISHIQFWKFKRCFFSRLTKKMTTLDINKIPNSDFTVIGSDQVWNRDITSYLAPSFFGDFAHNRLVALSSSFGKRSWSEEGIYTMQVKNLLKRFQAISVREDSGLEILNNVFQVDATQLLDPTLIYGDFFNFIKRKGRNKNEIFCFIFNNSSNVKAIKLTISRELHLPLKKENFITRRLCASPISWLNNIYNSKFVVTDSFHGVAFCVIFKKNFVALCANKEKFTRIESLLKKLGLLDRIIYSIDELNNNIHMLHNSINYNSVDKILELERQRCYDYLLRSFA